MGSDGLSPLERLRRRRHERWLEALQQQLAVTLAEVPCRVWLFGSRAMNRFHQGSDIRVR